MKFIPLLLALYAGGCLAPLPPPQNPPSTPSQRAQLLKAISSYEQLLDALRGGKHDAESICKVAKLLLATGQVEAAEARAREALEEAPLPGMSLCLNVLGAILQERNDLAQARKMYERALDLAQRPGQRALTQNNLGAVMESMGLLEEAEALYRSAMANADSPAHKARSMNNMASVLRAQGRLEEARALYSKALQTTDSPPDKATYLNNLGELAVLEKDYQRAATLLGQALKLTSQGPERSIRLNNLGRVLWLAGDRSEAASMFRSAMVFAQTPEDKALYLNNLGAVLRSLGDFVGAEEALSSASREPAGPDFRASSLINLAYLYLTEGQPAKALEHFEKTLSLLGLTTIAGQGLSARPVWSVVPPPFPLLTAMALVGRSRALGELASQAGPRATVLMTKATASAGAALTVLDGLEPATWTGKERGIVLLLESLADVLMGLGHGKRAFDVVERARWWKLVASLGNRPIRVDDPSIEEAISRIRVAAQRAVALRRATGSDGHPLKPITLANSLAELHLAVHGLRRLDPKFLGLYRNDPVALSDIAKDLPPGATLLAYYPSSDVLYILALARDRLVFRSVPVSQGELENAVLTIHRSMRLAMTLDVAGAGSDGFRAWGEDQPASQPLRRALVNLHGWMIQPIQDLLPSHGHLLFMTYGPVHLVPFAALAREGPQGLEYLIDRYSVSALTTSDLLRVARRAEEAAVGPGARVVIMADPAGSLPWSHEEGRRLADLWPRSMLFAGPDATEARLRQEAAQAEILHLATHAEIRPGGESAIILAPEGAEDGRLTIPEILGLPLQRGVRVVVLSACETAVSAEGVGEDGGGFESLERAFAAAGAPSLVASLWRVSSGSSARLMVEFHGALARGVPLAVALRGAMIRLRDGASEPGRAVPLSHPYHWASFSLIGVWR